MIISTITAFALTAGQILFSYNGTGICSKDAIGSYAFINGGNGITVSHSITAWNSAGTPTMNIYMLLEKAL